MVKVTQITGCGLIASLCTLSLVAQIAQAPQLPSQEVVAHGTVTLSGPHGDEAGTITVSASGEQYCKITITLGPQVLRRAYSAVLNGKTSVTTGPADLVAAVPLPATGSIGCGLVPEGLAYERLTGGSRAALALDANGNPVSLGWTVRGQAATVTYSGYGAVSGPVLAAKVTESVGGVLRLRIQFTAAANQAFSASDFALPPRPSQLNHGKAGQ